MGTLLIFVPIVGLFIYFGLKSFATPEDMEDFMQDVKVQNMQRKIRKQEKKRRKRQDWDEINMLWMMSDWLWDSDKKDK